MQRLALIVGGGLLLLGCGRAADSELPATSDGPVVVHLGEVVDADGEGSISLDVAVSGSRQVRIELDGEARIVEIAAAPPEGGDATLDGEAAHWFRPRPVDAPSLVLELAGSGVAKVTVWARGAPVPAARRERSLVWIDASILDEPSIVGLSRVLDAAADDGQGGVLLDRWFRRFATTAHSERAGPAQLMDELAAQFGADPAAWDLDALPFKVTGVHNRIDLAARDGGCGQLRVSLGSTDPVYAPLHVLFLFRQEPAEDDVAPDGTIHCLGTARRWARLSSLDGAAFVDAARAWLDRSISHDHFLLTESVELTVSPWEWRQWKPVGVDALDNPPLFQTVDIPGLNAAGPRRDAFLTFVGAHAADLDARTLEIPQAFRPPSARVPPNAPAEALDLTGLDEATLTSFPNVAHAIEMVGCPKCHTDNADFVQTSLDRTFSPFYDAELDARAHRLDRMNAGDDVGDPPFGPLQ